MKTLEFHYIPGDECWIKGQQRVCIIDEITVGKKHNGELDITYTWYNLDYGVDITELWDDGYFGPEDIGKTVFDSYEDYQKAFPEDFEYPEDAWG